MPVPRFLFVASIALVACGGDDVGELPDAPPGGLVPCVAPTGAGTEHTGELTASETWTAAASPHIVTTSDIVVRHGLTLTIEECAVVRVKQGRSIVIGGFSTADGTGALVAQGTAQTDVTRPVTITSDTAAVWWGSLQILTTGSANLSVVTLDRGGDPSQTAGGGGTLLMRGDDNRLQPLRNVRANNLKVTSSATYGINARTSAGFTADSGDIAITGAGAQGAMSAGEDSRYAMYIEAPAIKTVPLTTTISGNTRNEILAYAPFTVAVDERFPATGVPYQIRDRFYMEPTTMGAVITLTIDPGVTLKLGGPLGNNPSIKLGSGSGPTNNFPVRLIANGTAAAPIKITSGAAVPAAGDWAAIDWQGGPATGNVMHDVTVEYGGGTAATNGFGCGPGDNSSLLLITDWRPDDAFIQSSTFAHSAGGGIVSGWSSDAAGPNFRTGNTFQTIANACEISMPKSMAGACPGNDTVPDCY